jgi:membrane protease YdiL (CAAX protease family)
MRIRQSAEKPLLRQLAGVNGLPDPIVRPWPGLAGTLLLVHALLALLAVLLRLAWPPLQQLVGDGTLFAFVISGVLMQGVLILLPTVLVILGGHIPTASLLGGKPRAGSVILAVTAGIPAAVVFQGMNNLLIYGLVKSGIHLPEPSASGVAAGDNLFSQSWPIIVLVLLISVIMPGLIEELMFRGVILSAFSSTGAGAAAILWQAAAFAVFHAEPLFLLPPFLAGLMLATIRLRSDSLLPAILAHMSLNLSMLVLAPLLPQLTAGYLTASAGAANSLLYASLIAACVAAVALVPLLVLISHLQTRRPEHGRRLGIWPADWKFGLAFIVLLVTMVIEYS